MATKLVRHSGVQKEVLHLYASFFRALRNKPDQRVALAQYLFEFLMFYFLFLYFYFIEYYLLFI